MNKLKLILTIATLFTAVHATYAHDFTVDGIYYNILSDTTVEVTFRGERAGEYADYYSEDIVIPETVNSYTVVAIGDNAFYQCDKVTSVEIPNTVTLIGENAFRDCSGLTSIVIPNSVLSIGDGAFAYCESMTSATIGSQVGTIANQAFYRCYKLQSIEIPDSTISIGQYAFYDCTDLQSIYIGNSVTTIGKFAFGHCEKVQTLVLGSSLSSIGADAFYDCENLYSLTSLNTTPPTCENDYVFCWVNKTNCTLYVPESALSLYKRSQVWLKFTYIQPLATTGINESRFDDITISNDCIYNYSNHYVEVFDLSGRQIYYGNDTTIPIADKGIYIVRVGNSTRKIAIN